MTVFAWRAPSKDSVRVLDVRDGIGAAVALDIEAHLVARAQALEQCGILDAEDAPAAVQELLWDGLKLQGDRAGLAIDGNDAAARERLVIRQDRLLVGGRLGPVVDLRLARQRLHRQRLTGRKDRCGKSEPYKNVLAGHRSTLPSAIW